MKYALGTAQFGLDYGINNARGKIPPAEIDGILTAALSAGIEVLDTAPDYGNSEDLIGAFNSRHPEAFKIVTKLPDCGGEEAAWFFERSLQRLKTGSVYGLLVHHFSAYEKDKSLGDVLKQFKSQRRVKKIGFSLYYPKDLLKLFENAVDVDLVQVPYNIFDRRFEPFFGLLKARGVEVHARSVFLQGLIFKQPDDLKGKLSPLSQKLASLHTLSRQHEIPLWAMALNFVQLNENVDKVVLGVDGLTHLKSWLQAEQFLKSTKNILEELRMFQEDDEGVILPVNWK